MTCYAERLKEIRIEYQKTQKQIADVLNISQQHYSLYETGKRILNAEQIRTICRYYNISADYLLGLTDSFNRLKSSDNR